MSLMPDKKVIEEVESDINGKITVVKSLGFGTYIQVEGLTQSGGVVHGVWKTTLKKIKKRKDDVQDVLILGLGGGSAASLVNNLWPESKITGVDIDPEMVRLGKKYLGIPDINIEIADALEFVKNKKEKYDMVLVDTYVFDEFPKEMEKEPFLKNIKGLLTKNGIAIFNRLYWEGKRKDTIKFGEKLEENFKKVEWIYPEANLMFVCYNLS